jgi:hypothetical protein
LIGLVEGHDDGGLTDQGRLEVEQALHDKRRDGGYRTISGGTEATATSSRLRVCVVRR